MNEHELRKSFNAGKHILERGAIQLGLVIICIIMDAALIYVSLTATITELILVNIILTFGSCLVVDGGAELLSILVFKDIDIRIKVACHVILLAIMSYIFYQLGCFRIETIDSLVGNHLGLVSNDTVPGLKTLGHYIAVLPVATTIFIYVSGIIAHDPEKRNNDIRILMARSYNRTTQLMKAQVMYGTEEERKSEMYAYTNAQTEAARNDVLAAETGNNLLYNHKLAEHIGADSEQISIIMEE